LDINLLKQTIGRKLKQARKDQDLTQDDVAAKLDISAVAYGSFERGTNLIALNYLIEVSRIFGKPLTFFLSSYVTPEELNDPLADPYVQRYIAAIATINDRNIIESNLTVLEHIATVQAAKRNEKT